MMDGWISINKLFKVLKKRNKPLIGVLITTN